MWNVVGAPYRYAHHLLTQRYSSGSLLLKMSAQQQSRQQKPSKGEHSRMRDPNNTFNSGEAPSITCRDEAGHTKSKGSCRLLSLWGAPAPICGEIWSERPRKWLTPTSSTSPTAAKHFGRPSLQLFWCILQTLVFNFLVRGGTLALAARSAEGASAATAEAPEFGQIRQQRSPHPETLGQARFFIAQEGQDSTSLSAALASTPAPCSSLGVDAEAQSRQPKNQGASHVELRIRPVGRRPAADIAASDSMTGVAGVMVDLSLVGCDDGRGDNNGDAGGRCWSAEEYRLLADFDSGAVRRLQEPLGQCERQPLVPLGLCPGEHSVSAWGVPMLPHDTNNGGGGGSSGDNPLVSSATPASFGIHANRATATAAVTTDDFLHVASRGMDESGSGGSADSDGDDGAWIAGSGGGGVGRGRVGGSEGACVGSERQPPLPGRESQIRQGPDGGLCRVCEDTLGAQGGQNGDGDGGSDIIRFLLSSSVLPRRKRVMLRMCLIVSFAAGGGGGGGGGEADKAKVAHQRRQPKMPGQLVQEGEREERRIEWPIELREGDSPASAARDFVAKRLGLAVRLRGSDPDLFLVSAAAASVCSSEGRREDGNVHKGRHKAGEDAIAAGQRLVRMATQMLETELAERQAQRSLKRTEAARTLAGTGQLRVVLGAGNGNGDGDGDNYDDNDGVGPFRGASLPRAGWLATDINTLDVTNPSDFTYLLGPAGRIDAFVAEHVWEHLSLPDAHRAARNSRRHLRPGGRLRLAVPDPAWHSSSSSSSASSSSSSLSSSSSPSSSSSSSASPSSSSSSSSSSSWSPSPSSSSATATATDLSEEEPSSVASRENGRESLSQNIGSTALAFEKSGSSGGSGSGSGGENGGSGVGGCEKGAGCSSSGGGCGSGVVGSARGGGGGGDGGDKVESNERGGLKEARALRDAGARHAGRNGVGIPAPPAAGEDLPDWLSREMLAADVRDGHVVQYTPELLANVCWSAGLVPFLLEGGGGGGGIEETAVYREEVATGPAATTVAVREEVEPGEDERCVGGKGTRGETCGPPRLQKAVKPPPPGVASFPSAAEYDVEHQESYHLWGRIKRSIAGGDPRWAVSIVMDCVKPPVAAQNQNHEENTRDHIHRHHPTAFFAAGDTAEKPSPRCRPDGSDQDVRYRHVALRRLESDSPLESVVTFSPLDPLLSTTLSQRRPAALGGNLSTSRTTLRAVCAGGTEVNTAAFASTSGITRGIGDVAAAAATAGSSVAGGGGSVVAIAKGSAAERAALVHPGDGESTTRPVVGRPVAVNDQYVVAREKEFVDSSGGGGAAEIGMEMGLAMGQRVTPSRCRELMSDGGGQRGDTAGSGEGEFERPSPRTLRLSGSQNRGQRSAREPHTGHSNEKIGKKASENGGRGGGNSGRQSQPRPGSAHQPPPPTPAGDAALEWRHISGDGGERSERGEDAGDRRKAGDRIWVSAPAAAAAAVGGINVVEAGLSNIEATATRRNGPTSRGNHLAVLENVACETNDPRPHTGSPKSIFDDAAERSLPAPAKTNNLGGGDNAVVTPGGVDHPSCKTRVSPTLVRGGLRATEEGGRAKGEAGRTATRSVPPSLVIDNETLVLVDRFGQRSSSPMEPDRGEGGCGHAAHSTPSNAGDSKGNHDICASASVHSSNGDASGVETRSVEQSARNRDYLEERATAARKRRSVDSPMPVIPSTPTRGEQAPGGGHKNHDSTSGSSGSNSGSGRVVALLTPHDVKHARSRAKKSLLAGNVTDALERCRQILLERPSDGTTLLYQGAAMAQRGEWDAARSTMERVLALSSSAEQRNYDVAAALARTTERNLPADWRGESPRNPPFGSAAAATGLQRASEEEEAVPLEIALAAAANLATFARARTPESRDPNAEVFFLVEGLRGAAERDRNAGSQRNTAAVAAAETPSLSPHPAGGREAVGAKQDLEVSAAAQSLKRRNGEERGAGGDAGRARNKVVVGIDGYLNLLTAMAKALEEQGQLTSALRLYQRAVLLGGHRDQRALRGLGGLSRRLLEAERERIHRHRIRGGARNPDAVVTPAQSASTSPPDSSPAPPQFRPPSPVPPASRHPPTHPGLSRFDGLPCDHHHRRGQRQIGEGNATASGTGGAGAAAAAEGDRHQQQRQWHWERSGCEWGIKHPRPGQVFSPEDPIPVEYDLTLLDPGVPSAGSLFETVVVGDGTVGDLLLSADHAREKDGGSGGRGDGTFGVAVGEDGLGFVVCSYLENFDLAHCLPRGQLRDIGLGWHLLTAELFQLPGLRPFSCLDGTGSGDGGGHAGSNGNGKSKFSTRTVRFCVGDDAACSATAAGAEGVDEGKGGDPVMADADADVERAPAYHQTPRIVTSFSGDGGFVDVSGKRTEDFLPAAISKRRAKKDATAEFGSAAAVTTEASATVPGELAGASEGVELPFCFMTLALNAMPFITHHAPVFDEVGRILSQRAAAAAAADAAADAAAGKSSTPERSPRARGDDDTDLNFVGGKRMVPAPQPHSPRPESFWEWHVVEGVAAGRADHRQPYSRRRIPGRYFDPATGLSVDGTTEYLDSLMEVESKSESDEAWVVGGGGGDVPSPSPQRRRVRVHRRCGGGATKQARNRRAPEGGGSGEDKAAANSGNGRSTEASLTRTPLATPAGAADDAETADWTSSKHEHNSDGDGDGGGGRRGGGGGGGGGGDDDARASTCLWRDKIQMVNSVAFLLERECLLVQIDSDELWTADQLVRLRDMFLLERNGKMWGGDGGKRQPGSTGTSDEDNDRDGDDRSSVVSQHPQPYYPAQQQQQQQQQQHQQQRDKQQQQQLQEQGQQESHDLPRRRRERRECAYFDCHFFVGPNLVTVTEDGWGHSANHEWLRAWVFRPRGSVWVGHAPPQLVRHHEATGGWELLAGDSKCFGRAETRDRGLLFTHYAYVLEEQVRFKDEFYGHSETAVSKVDNPAAVPVPADAVAEWRALQNVTPPVLLADHLSWLRKQGEMQDPRLLTTVADRPPGSSRVRRRRRRRQDGQIREDETLSVSIAEVRWATSGSCVGEREQGNDAVDGNAERHIAATGGGGSLSDNAAFSATPVVPLEPFLQMARDSKSDSVWWRRGDGDRRAGESERMDHPELSCDVYTGMSGPRLEAGRLPASESGGGGGGGAEEEGGGGGRIASSGQGQGKVAAARSDSRCGFLHLVVDGVVFQVQAARPAGIARVWANVLPAMLDRLSEVDGTCLTLLVRGLAPSPPAVEEAFSRLTPRLADRFAVTHIPPYNPSFGFTADRLMLSWAVRSTRGATAFISTLYTQPFWATTRAVVQLLLVHDVLPEVLGWDMSSSEWREKSDAVAATSSVVTVSQHTAREFLRVYPPTLAGNNGVGTSSRDRASLGAAAARPVWAGHNGVDTTTFRPLAAADGGSGGGRSGIEAFRQLAGLDPGAQYVMIVGSRHRYKNARAAYRALGLAAAPAPVATGTANTTTSGRELASGGPPALVLVGGGPLLPEELELLADVGVWSHVGVGSELLAATAPETPPGGGGGRVGIAAVVDDALLAAGYSGAVALLHLSLAEGFGLTVLEAFACGCPVIAADIPPVREIAGLPGLKEARKAAATTQHKAAPPPHPLPAGHGIEENDGWSRADSGGGGGDGGSGSSGSSDDGGGSTVPRQKGGGRYDRASSPLEGGLILVQNPESATQVWRAVRALAAMGLERRAAASEALVRRAKAFDSWQPLADTLIKAAVEN